MDPQRLASFVKNTGLSYKQSSKSYVFTCPLCNGKEKLYIRKSDGKFACWRCRETKGFQGAPEFAFAELLNQTVKEVKEKLYGGSHVGFLPTYLDVGFYDLADDDDIIEDIPDYIPPLTFPYHCLPIGSPGTQKGIDYLNSRGIPVEIAKFYQIRYSPERLAIVFPSYVNKALVGWQFRSIEKSFEVLPDLSIVHRLKSLSSKDIPRDRTFMFQDHLVGLDHAVLCEGPVDAIKAHLVGGGVAALGKVITPAQVSILLRAGLKRVYVALDPDAFMELNPLLEKFNDALELLRVEIPEKDGKPDLGALSFEDARDCILEAKPLRRNKLYIWLRKP
jgi:hypothetical protein